MATIINVSSVTDYSGEDPVIVPSNPVTTVIRDPVPTPTSTRYFYDLSCNCCSCCCNCFDDCDF